MVMGTLAEKQAPLQCLLHFLGAYKVQVCGFDSTLKLSKPKDLKIVSLQECSCGHFWDIQLRIYHVFSTIWFIADGSYRGQEKLLRGAKSVGKASAL